MNRRQFLRAAGGAVAAAGIPAIVPSSALGLNGRIAPSNRITLGFIGMGAQNTGHWGACLHAEDAQALACCDVDGLRRDYFQKSANDYYASESPSGRTKGCGAYGDFRDLLAREDIDAVVIATPDHWHAIAAIMACEAGKDVYCEKPLSLTIREARAMVEAARRNGRVFQTGSQQRSSANFRFACEMVRSGRIGKMHTVHVNVGGPSGPCDLPPQTPPKTLDWDMWLGPAPWRPFHTVLCPAFPSGFPPWRRYRDYSGGGMTDWGAHHFDIAQWGLGMDESGPVEIIPPDGKDVERLTYRYANGVVMYHGGAAGPAGVEFIGTEGRVLVNRGYLETDPADIMKEPTSPDEVNLYRSPGHHQDWFDCIRTRRRPICDVEIGCRSATVCHLGNIAYWTKQPFRWDPEKEEIIDNPAASRWLSRPMREPWVL
ncbi:MAG TPA: Gfo/Idh/MocA family oxidoreductase [Sumerlaeia bacterium]|nr:Gfo/Idh/MocA family oxidoreductase [Sumerlaeia bacterium]